VGEMSSARETALEIKTDKGRAAALTAVAVSEAETGERAAACEAVNLINDPSLRAYGFTAVAEAHGRKGDVAAARDRYADAVANAQTVAAEQSRAKAMSDVAVRQVRDGLAEDVLMILNPGALPPNVVREVAIAFAEAGDTARLTRAIEACAEYEELVPAICEC